MTPLLSEHQRSERYTARGSLVPQGLDRVEAGCTGGGVPAKQQRDEGYHDDRGDSPSPWDRGRNAELQCGEVAHGDPHHDAENPADLAQHERFQAELAQYLAAHASPPFTDATRSRPPTNGPQ